MMFVINNQRENKKLLSDCGVNHIDYDNWNDDDDDDYDDNVCAANLILKQHIETCKTFQLE